MTSSKEEQIKVNVDRVNKYRIRIPNLKFRNASITNKDFMSSLRRPLIQFILYHVRLCYAMLCYAILYHTKLCYTMLFSIILYSHLPVELYHIIHSNVPPNARTLFNSKIFDAAYRVR